MFTLIKIRYTLHPGPHLRNLRHPAITDCLLIGKDKSDEKMANFVNFLLRNSECTDFCCLGMILSVRDAQASMKMTPVKGACFVFCTGDIVMRIPLQELVSVHDRA